MIVFDIHFDQEFIFALVPTILVRMSAVVDDAPRQIISSPRRAPRGSVFPHDLDFGMLLASTKASSPSIIQVLTAS